MSVIKFSHMKKVEDERLNETLHVHSQNGPSHAWMNRLLIFVISKFNFASSNESHPTVYLQLKFVLIFRGAIELLDVN